MKGITSCSAKKLMLLEDEVREYFDVSPDWWFIAPKGAITREYAKPILLCGAAHLSAAQRAAKEARAAAAAVRKSLRGREGEAQEIGATQRDPTPRSPIS